MNLTITGFSTALFSTWFFIDELGLLFDAGDGVSSGLLQKSGKVKSAFISHADRDHLAGLLQFNQLNARNGLSIIYYPRNCGSFPALESFCNQFDPHTANSKWLPIEQNDSVEIGKNIWVQAIRNNHVICNAAITKSLSYKVCKTKWKLKSEFKSLRGEAIKNLIASKGKGAVMDLVHENLITYSGDTPVDDYSRWDGSNILIHEATFLGGEEDAKIKKHANKHSKLEDVLKMVSEIRVEKLVLSHFSNRYKHEQILLRVRELCNKYRIEIPVFCVLPGEVSRDILSGEPVNS